MSHRDPDEDPPPSAPVISGEATLPDEHTRRVATLKHKKDGPTEVKVHDAAPDPSAVHPAEMRTSTELSSDRERFHRQKKRERDRRAERVAFAAVILLFLAIGGAGYMITNSIVDDVPKEPTLEQLEAARSKARVIAEDKRTKNTSHIDETPDLPALRMMKSEGLTIAAEGLPEVSSAMESNEVGPLAALETCRFAYGVWEFSPNKRFRFLTTCQAKEDQILVGAYEIQGSKVIMSPLTDAPATFVSVLEVEKPSTMNTQVSYGAIVLDVAQRINTLRGGMEGEAFRATYVPKNTLMPSGNTKPKSKDPLFDAIKQPGQ